MQQLTEVVEVVTELATNAAQTELENAAFGERLLAQAHQAMRRLDINECTRIADWAKENRSQAAGPALCTLLRKPRTFKGLQSWRRDAWIQMRISAIQALALNQDHLAAPTLAHVLIHDVPAVREEARSAMQALGSNAVLPIVDTIRVSTDWPIGGMLCAIDTLGLIRDKNAGPTLARILFGLLPNTSSRWTVVHLKWAAILGAIETAGVAGSTSFNSGDVVQASFLFAAIGCSMMFALFSFLSYIGIFVFIRNGKRNEANRVNTAAANALINIKDPRSVPSLIEVATEKYSQSARAGAVHALRETLPVLTSSDYGLLTGPVERRLTGMFAWHNPQLVLAAVRALEFVGTGQSVGHVERLARRKPVLFDAGVNGEIRSEAERVLPVLLERKRLEEASSVLLRPSQVAPESSGVLLRPVSSLSAYEEPVEQLLRPGSE